MSYSSGGRAVFRFLGALVLAGVLVHPAPSTAACTDCDGDSIAWPADCNDADPGVFPGATELCDGFDNDCSGSIDDGGSCIRVCGTPDASAQGLVSTDPAGSQQADIAWTGTDYGIVWKDGRHAADEIYFSRVDADGVSQTGEVRVTVTTAASSNPRIVWTGTEFGVVWVDQRDGNAEVYFNRLSLAGLTAGTDVPVSARDGFASTQADIVWTGSAYGTVWTDARHDVGSGDREIYFNSLDESGNLAGSDVRVTTDSALSEQPAVAWNGTGFGVAWTDERDLNREIYVNILSAAGTPTLTDVRLTTAAGVSAQPSIAWTGSGYGIAWTDERDLNREIYFARVSAAGVKEGSDTPLTVDLDISEQPAVAWSGEEFAVVWRDTRVFGGEVFLARVDSSGVKQGTDERVSQDLGQASRLPRLVWTGAGYGITWHDAQINLARVDCGCGDADGDGVTSCDGDCDDGDPDTYPGAPQVCDGVNNDCAEPAWPALVGTNDGDDDGDTLSECAGDCDDGDPDTYPGAPQICDGVNNDCLHPSWPAVTGTSENDDDGDTVSECAGDCDDTRAAVYPGAPEVCDGVRNDCDAPGWPSVAGTAEDDSDGDGFSACDSDCDPADGQIWLTPGASNGLTVAPDTGGATVLTWFQPAQPGAAQVVYDTVRSKNATSFTGGGTSCVEADGVDTISVDSGGNLQVGDVFYYLVRPENSCPAGAGDVGTATDGTPRIVRSCN